MKLQATNLVQVDQFQFSGVNLRCVFKNSDPFAGAIESFKSWAKGRGVQFAKGGSIALDTGEQVGVFPVFLPTNQRHRDFLAGAMNGVEIPVGTAYRFFRPDQGIELAEALKRAAIPFSKDGNFLWGVQEADKTPAQSLEDAPQGVATPADV